MRARQCDRYLAACGLAIVTTVSHYRAVAAPAPVCTAGSSSDDVGGCVQALYVGAVDTGTLSGPEAVSAAVDVLFDGQPWRPLTQTTTHVDVRLTGDGILLTDNLRR